MSSVGQAFDNALGLLREKYVARLSGTIAELNQFAVLCEFEEATAEMVAAIGRLAHKLSGSGQTLGFPEISTSAIDLERLLEVDTPPLDDVAAGARALARACEAATRVSQDRQSSSGTEESAETGAEKKPKPTFLAFHAGAGLGNVLADVFSGRAAIRHCITLTAVLDAMDSAGASLLLVDLDNPECPRDEIATLHRKAAENNIAIVAVTAQRRTAAVANAVSDGKIDCLLKPFDPVSLYTKAFQAMARQRLIAIVCDDDRIVREFLKPKFEARGFDVHFANDGEEAIELARRIQPSVIVLDRSMPKVDGLAALKILKADTVTHGIPIVMLTSKALPHEVTEGLRSGAAAYMVKPFAPAAVVAKCLEILGARPIQRD